VRAKRRVAKLRPTAGEEEWLRVLEVFQSSPVLGISSYAIDPDVPLEQILSLGFAVYWLCLTPEAALGSHKSSGAWRALRRGAEGAPQAKLALGVWLANRAPEAPPLSIYCGQPPTPVDREHIFVRFFISPW
jgi:hypothetical protein